MYLTLVVLPLLGALATNRKCGIFGGPIVSILCIFVTTIISVMAFFEVALNQSPVSIK